MLTFVGIVSGGAKQRAEDEMDMANTTRMAAEYNSCEADTKIATANTRKATLATILLTLQADLENAGFSPSQAAAKVTYVNGKITEADDYIANCAYYQGSYEDHIDAGDPLYAAAVTTYQNEQYNASLQNALDAGLEYDGAAAAADLAYGNSFQAVAKLDGVLAEIAGWLS